MAAVRCDMHARACARRALRIRSQRAVNRIDGISSRDAACTRPGCTSAKRDLPTRRMARWLHVSAGTPFRRLGSVCSLLSFLFGGPGSCPRLVERAASILERGAGGAPPGPTAGAGGAGPSGGGACGAGGDARPADPGTAAQQTGAEDQEEAAGVLLGALRHSLLRRTLECLPLQDQPPGVGELHVFKGSTEAGKPFQRCVANPFCAPLDSWAPTPPSLFHEACEPDPSANCSSALTCVATRSSAVCDAALQAAMQ
jgi:hypothetical protein